MMALLIQKDKTKKKEKRIYHNDHHNKRPISLVPANKVCKTSKKVAVPVNDVQMEVGEAEE